MADAIIHEFGHALDAHIGYSGGDGASSEAQADTLAMIEMRNGCINEGWHTTQNCYRCRPTCKGRRDLHAFAEWGAINEIAKPSTITSNVGINCDRSPLPPCNNDPNNLGSTMGYEAHCESYIASTTNLDLAKNLIDAYGTTNGWNIMTQLWFDTLPGIKRAFRIFSGGKCNPYATIDGCGVYNWYKVMIAADDSDGNLANGTPHGCHIYDAYTLHGIGCEPQSCHP